MNCSYCQKPTPASTRFCVHCNTDLHRAPSEARGSHIVCRACHCDMEIINVDEIEIDICPRCSSVWLDRGELEALTPMHGALGRNAVATRKPLASTHAAYVRCPVCDTAMVRRAHPHAPRLRLASCSNHGIWFEQSDALMLFELMSSAAPRLDAHTKKPTERVPRVHLPPERYPTPRERGTTVEIELFEGLLELFDIFD